MSTGSITHDPTRLGQIDLVQAQMPFARRSANKKASAEADALELVEAGGVEPPSEKARSEETTCVARFFLFGQYFRAGKRGTVPSPIDLGSRLRTEVCSLSR